MELVYKIIKAITDRLAELLFPPFCLGCQIKNEILCRECLNSLPRSKKQMDDNVFTLFEYRDPLVKKIIWDLKYHHHAYLGQKLGELLYDEIIEEISDIHQYNNSPILVIPVPISKTKMRKRGYNQAQKIAIGFCRRGGNEIFKLKNNIVVKKVETIPQARIKNRQERLKNIRGAFKIKNPKLIKKQTIIIIDDVTTTGGTINEIKKILKKSGAKKVIGITLAH